ncbi:MAG TPA: hypothetical protein VL326_08720, partial [Kofleriaceae bacterium]|nr:hypothetical protein [Kofleriaceae bacterium]
MVLRFTAKVKKREIRVREVGLPDGAVVDVTIKLQSEPIEELPPEVWAQIRESEREARRGGVISGEESVRRLRAISLQGRGESTGGAHTGTRNPSLG